MPKLSINEINAHIEEAGGLLSLKTRLLIVVESWFNRNMIDDTFGCRSHIDRENAAIDLGEALKKEFGVWGNGMPAFAPYAFEFYYKNDKAVLGDKNCILSAVLGDKNCILSPENYCRTIWARYNSAKLGIPSMLYFHFGEKLALKVWKVLTDHDLEIDYFNLVMPCAWELKKWHKICFYNDEVFLARLNSACKYISKRIEAGKFIANKSRHGYIFVGVIFSRIKPNRWVMRSAERFESYLRGCFALPEEALKDISTRQIVNVGRLSWKKRVAVANSIKLVQRDDGYSYRRVIDWEKVAYFDGSDLSGTEKSVWVWLDTFGRVPKVECIKKIKPKLIKALYETKNFKFFMRMLKNFSVQNYKDSPDVIYAMANLAVAFGANSLQLVPNGSDFSEGAKLLKLHDLGVEMKAYQYPSGTELSAFLWKHIKTDRRRDAIKIANNYNKGLRKKIRLDMPFAEMLDILKSQRYIDASDYSFARECANWKISKRHYSNMEKRWLKGIKGIKYETIPNIRIEKNGYVIERLERENPAGLFLGEYTDCCQHPEGQGQYAAWHGATNENGCFYVIRYNDNIIAQSWVWREGNAVVFDSIEGLHGYDSAAKCELYTELANKMVGWLGIELVAVGDINTDVDAFRIYGVDEVRVPGYIEYTDAKCNKTIAKKEKNKVHRKIF